MTYEEQSWGIALGIVLVGMAVCWVLARINFLPHLSGPQNRYKTIDGLRGLAAFAVVANHAPFALGNAGMPLTQFGVMGHVYGNMGSLGVQIFFCITGFLFFDRAIQKRGQIDWADFYGARIRRLAPLYLFVAAIVAALSIRIAGNSLDWGLPKTGLNLASIFAFGFLGSPVKVGAFDTTPLNTVIWTLAYEWRFYFVFPFLAYLVTGRMRASIALAIALGFMVLDFATAESVMWPYFLTGLAGAYLHNRDARMPAWLGGLLLAASLGLAVYLPLPLYGWERYGIVTAGFLAAVMGRPALVAVPALRYLGEISYSVYLLHLPVLFVLSRLLMKVYPNGVSYDVYLAQLAAGAALVALVSALTYRFIEHPFLAKRLRRSAPDAGPGTRRPASEDQARTA